MGGINCCRDCVKPKRHENCHSECKEYLAERKKLDEENLEMRKYNASFLNSSNYSLGDVPISLNHFGRNKKYKKHKNNTKFNNKDL